MGIVQDICILALRPLIGDAAEPAVRLICDHLTNHSQRFPLALQTANDRAWMALELALVEEIWWQKIWSNWRAADERALAKQVQAFLEKQSLSELRGQPGDYQQECWRELRLARELPRGFSRGWISRPSGSASTLAWLLLCEMPLACSTRPTASRFAGSTS